MSDTADTANVIVRPPIAWALAVLVGLTLQWVVSLPFMPASVPAGWIGGIVFVLALALFAWAIATMTRAGSNVPTNLPTTTIVETGPYRFTRNPIYLGMFLGLVGLAIAFDSLWLLVMLVPFTLAIRYGVVAREEAYLERKFGDAYRQYRRTAAAQAGRTAAAQAGRTAAGNVKTAVGHSRITARDVRAAASHRCTRKFADRLDGFNPQATRTVKGGVHDHAGIA